MPIPPPCRSSRLGPLARGLTVAAALAFVNPRPALARSPQLLESTTWRRTPDQWFAEFNSVEKDFDEVLSRWLAADRAIGTSDLELQLINEQLDDVNAQERDLRVSQLNNRTQSSETAEKLAAADARFTVMDDALLELQRASVAGEAELSAARETALATAASLREWLKPMGGQTRAAITALSALEAWEVERRGLNWDSIAAGQSTSVRAQKLAGKVLGAVERVAPLSPHGDDLLLAAQRLVDTNAELDRLELHRIATALDLERFDGAGLGALDVERSTLRSRLDELDTERARIEQRLDAALARKQSLEERKAALTTLSNPVKPEVEALAERYLRLSLGVEVLQARVDTKTWCGLWVHGGMSALLAGTPDSAEMLNNAVVAMGGRCEGIVRPYLAIPVAKLAWADAVFAAAPPTSWVDVVVDGQQWLVDGAPLHTVGRPRLELRAGQHRFELSTEGVVREALVASLDADVSYQLALGADRLELVEIPPGEPSRDDRRVPYRTLVKQVSRGSSNAARPFTFGPVAGASALHGYLFTTLGGGAHLDPDWKLGLSFDASVVAELGTTPVYITEREYTTSLPLGVLALRWSPPVDWHATPFITLGGFGEPGVGLGPWGGLGCAFRLGDVSFDLLASSPVYLDETAGPPGLELRVQPRFGLPPRRGDHDNDDFDGSDP